jgi:hypothetical protein
VVRVCGRYASSWNPLDLGDHFAVERIDPVSDDAQQAGTTVTVPAGWTFEAGGATSDM